MNITQEQKIFPQRNSSFQFYKKSVEQNSQGQQSQQNSINLLPENFQNIEIEAKNDLISSQGSISRTVLQQDIRLNKMYTDRYNTKAIDQSLTQFQRNFNLPCYPSYPFLIRQIQDNYVDSLRKKYKIEVIRESISSINDEQQISRDNLVSSQKYDSINNCEKSSNSERIKLTKQGIPKQKIGRPQGQRQNLEAPYDKNKKNYMRYVLALFHRFAKKSKITDKESIKRFRSLHKLAQHYSLANLNDALETDEFKEYFLQFLNNLQELLQEDKCKLSQEVRQNFLQAQPHWIKAIQQFGRLPTW